MTHFYGKPDGDLHHEVVATTIFERDGFLEAWPVPADEIPEQYIITVEEWTEDSTGRVRCIVDWTVRSDPEPDTGIVRLPGDIHGDVHGRIVDNSDCAR